MVTVQSVPYNKAKAGDQGFADGNKTHEGMIRRRGGDRLPLLSSCTLYTKLLCKDLMEDETKQKTVAKYIGQPFSALFSLWFAGALSMARSNAAAQIAGAL